MEREREGSVEPLHVWQGVGMQLFDADRCTRISYMSLWTGWRAAQAHVEFQKRHARIAHFALHARVWHRTTPRRLPYASGYAHLQGLIVYTYKMASSKIYVGNLDPRIAVRAVKGPATSMLLSKVDLVPHVLNYVMLPYACRFVHRKGT